MTTLGPLPLRRRRNVGLAITDRGLHAVEVSSGRRRAVVRHASVVLDPGTVVDGSVRDIGDFADACRELWAQGRFSTRSVVASLGSHDAVVRSSVLPPLARRDVAGALRFELADQLPFPVDESVIDSVEIDRPVDDDGVQTVRHLVVAARTEVIGNLVQALDRAGLAARHLDIPAFSAARLDRSGADGDATTDRVPTDGVPTAVVLPGEGLIAMAVHVDGTVHFARTVYLDRSIDQELSAVLEAELSAIEVARGGAPGSSPERESDPVAAAVTATLEHHRSLDPEGAAGRIHVLGDGPEVAALARSIEARTGIVTRIRPTLQGTPGTGGLHGCDLLAAGQAIRATGGLDGPAWPRLAVTGMVGRHSLAREAVATGVATAALALGAVLLLGPDPAVAHRQTDSLQSEIDSLDAQLAARGETDEQAAELAWREDLVAESRSSSIDWPRILAAVEAGLPEGSTLLSVEATAPDPRTGTEGAIRLTVEAPDSTAVESWLSLLGGIDGLSEPWLDVAAATETATVGGPITFSVRAAVRPAGDTPEGEG